MASHALFVGSADHASPVNTGVFLIKPRRFLYQEAIRLLRGCSWNEKTGFDGAGDPHDLSNDSKLLLRLAAGTGSLGHVTRKMKGTAFVKERTWLFVGGNIDQGASQQSNSLLPLPIPTRRCGGITPTRKPPGAPAPRR